MKVCYLDCFSGISGDMFLGALVDAGLPPGELQAELEKLKLPGWSLATERVRRGALTATKLTFNIQEAHHHRTWKTIREMVRSSELAPAVRERAEHIFARLAEAEAAVHGTTPDQVHFHEVGALDSILDVVGASVAVERMGIEKICASQVNVGQGTVETAHGLLPVPAPAAARLLQGAPVYSSGIAAELVTPTGAALLAGLGAEYGPLPPMTVSAVGCGAGSRELTEQPNVLRVFLGESQAATAGQEEPEVTIIEANLDDMNPLVGGYFMEEALAQGALDVYYTPVQMKKNRPGLLLTLVCRPEQADALCRLVFEQTTTIGVRFYQARRRTLERSHMTVETSLGPVRIKLARLNGRVLNAAPEYEDCRRVARERGVPLKEVLVEAQACFRQQTKDAS